MREYRALAAVAACLLVALSVSGCVDIYGSKDLFSRRGPAAKPVFKTVTKAEASHDFETDLTDPTSLSYSYVLPFKVKNGAEWLKVKISLVLIPLPAQIPGDLVPERSLRVKVIMADGSIWVDARYTNSTQEEVTAQNPIDGPWSVTVDATGVGYSKFGYRTRFECSSRDTSRCEALKFPEHLKIERNSGSGFSPHCDPNETLARVLRSSSDMSGPFHAHGRVGSGPHPAYRILLARIAVGPQHGGVAPWPFHPPRSMIQWHG